MFIATGLSDLHYMRYSALYTHSRTRIGYLEKTRVLQKLNHYPV